MDIVLGLKTKYMSKVIAIHQPNFFPWLGYFDKIARADVFIFLDDVQFPKTGGVWTNRVKLIISGKARWVTAPIDRTFNGVRVVNEIFFLDNDRWRSKFLKTLEINYSKHPYFAETMHVISTLIDYDTDNLADFNANAITAIAQCLGLDISKIIRSSELPVSGYSNELLCDLTLTVGGNIYMCGGGAEAYQDEAIFQQKSVELKQQNFSHPQYKQFNNQGNFIPGLSIIDALMNLGFNGVRKELIGKNG